MSKESYFHSFQFNCSLIMMFFIALAGIAFAILPATGLHRLGTAASDELGLYADPPRHPQPAVRTPSPQPVHGLPVAMTTQGETP